MSDKKFDFSVLPDGFLIQSEPDYCDDISQWPIQKMDYYNREYSWGYKPLCNHWHFNDGSMVLPDGLVVECVLWNRQKTRPSVVIGGYINDLNCSDESIMAIKIIGAHPDYAKNAKELGMEVIE